MYTIEKASKIFSEEPGIFIVERILYRQSVDVEPSAKRIPNPNMLHCSEISLCSMTTIGRIDKQVFVFC